MPPLDPDVADLAPSDPVLTVYDEQHAVTYMRMLDADANRREVARIVLHIDRSAKLIGRGGRSRAILPAPNGRGDMGYRLLLQRGWPRADA
jgi:hypothetical protein